MDLLHINIFYQDLVDYLSNLTVQMFSLIQSLLLLIFCMDTMEALATLNYVLFYFHLYSHQD